MGTVFLVVGDTVALVLAITGGILVWKALDTKNPNHSLAWWKEALLCLAFGACIVVGASCIASFGLGGLYLATRNM